MTSPATTDGNTQPTSGRAHRLFDDALNDGAMVAPRIPLDAPGG